MTFWGAGASAVRKIKQGHNTEDDPVVGWVEATSGKVIRRNNRQVDNAPSRPGGRLLQTEE